LKSLILAGGMGKRLRPLTYEKPKPLIEVAGKPILVWQIEWLKKYNVNEVILCVGYQKEKIIEFIGSGAKFGIKVGYAVEDEPLGTGGGIKNAEALLRNEDRILVLNGDIITDLNPLKLIEELNDGVGAIAVTPLRSPYGIVDVDDKGYAKYFKEKPLIENYWINAGIYCFTSEIFDYLPEKGDIETTAFPKLAFEKKLKAVKYKDIIWKSIDTHKDIEEVEKELISTKI